MPEWFDSAFWSVCNLYSPYALLFVVCMLHFITFYFPSIWSCISLFAFMSTHFTSKTWVSFIIISDLKDIFVISASLMVILDLSTIYVISSLSLTLLDLFVILELALATNLGLGMQWVCSVGLKVGLHVGWFY